MRAIFVSMSTQPITDKKYLAKVLFTREKLDQKVVAERVGVSEKTMSKWVNEENWRSLRDRLLVGKEEVLNNLYDQLAELNEVITDRPKGQRYGSSKEADIQIKLTASIRNLETELAIADLVESGIRFIKYLQQTSDHEKVIEISNAWNEFITNSMKP